MYLTPILALLPLFPAAPQAAATAPGAPRGLDNETAIRVSKAVQGRIAVVELLERVPGGREFAVHSAQGVVIGPKHFMTIAPWMIEAVSAPVLSPPGPSGGSGEPPPGSAGGTAAPSPNRSLSILVEEG